MPATSAAATSASARASARAVGSISRAHPHDPMGLDEVFPLLVADDLRAPVLLHVDDVTREELWRDVEIRRHEDRLQRRLNPVAFLLGARLDFDDALLAVDNRLTVRPAAELQHGMDARLLDREHVRLQNLHHL